MEKYPEQQEGSLRFQQVRKHSTRDPTALFNGVTWVSQGEKQTSHSWCTGRSLNLPSLVGVMGGKLRAGEGVLSIVPPLIGWADAGGHELPGTPKLNVFESVCFCVHTHVCMGGEHCGSFSSTDWMIWTRESDSYGYDS